MARIPYRLQVAANYDYGQESESTTRLASSGRGGPRLTNDQTHAVFGRVAASVECDALARGHDDWDSARYQAFDPRERASFDAHPDPASDRLTAAGTVETRVSSVSSDRSRWSCARAFA